MTLHDALKIPRGGGSAAQAGAVDLSFELTADLLPRDYALALADAVGEVLPGLADDELFGIHPIRGAWTEAGLVLSRRSRLLVRVAKGRDEEVLSLAGRTLRVGEVSLAVGAGTPRPVTAFPTLRSAVVLAPHADEQAFIDEVGLRLAVLGVEGEPICGKAARVITPSGVADGFSLVLHGVSSAHSLRLQTVGLGPHRRLGCGLFVHHKLIQLADASPDY